MLIPRRLLFLFPALAMTCKVALAQPGLNINDFQCFANRYAAGDQWANLDASTSTPVLNVNDFQTFLNLYAARDQRADCDSQQPQWTDLSLPTGSVSYWVSSSGGSDTNPGTIAAPFATINRGLSALRNGFPDQVLLKCGDTWVLNDQITLTKSANSATQYMVLGSYGAGDRPKIRTPSHGIFGGNTSQRRGFAIVGLDLAPIAMTSGSDGIILLSGNGGGWDNVLIEDCYISGYSAGIVGQSLVDGDTFDGLKIRYCVVADNDNNGGGHAQGIFLGGAFNWLIEGCLLDNNARSKNDIFCHNLYAHQFCGPGIVRNNISSRACSHGGQQRSGGTTENNLFLGNPINFYQGSYSEITGPTVNTFIYNVALDSRNINASDIRGIAFTLSGAAGSKVKFNVAAHQRTGTGNVTAFDMDGLSAAEVMGNAVLEWTYGGQHWGQAYSFNPNCHADLFANNIAYQPTHGTCLSGFQVIDLYSTNRYWTTSPGPFYGMTSTAWMPHESFSTFAQPAPIDVTIAAYMQSIGLSGDVAEFAAMARLNTRQHFDFRFTSDAVNDFVRARLGVTPN